MVGPPRPYTRAGQWSVLVPSVQSHCSRHTAAGSTGNSSCGFSCAVRVSFQTVAAPSTHHCFPWTGSQGLDDIKTPLIVLLRV